MSKARTNPGFLNGVPAMLILQLLRRRPTYGYELVQAIRRATDHVLSFDEGCVYPLLHRLEAEGMLAGRRELVAGRSRIVYGLTEAGMRRLETSVSQWRTIAGAVERVLGGNEHGSASPA